MRQRLVRISFWLGTAATLVSALLFLASIALCVRSYFRIDELRSVSLPSEGHPRDMTLISHTGQVRLVWIRHAFQYFNGDPFPSLGRNWATQDNHFGKLFPGDTTLGFRFLSEARSMQRNGRPVRIYEINAIGVPYFAIALLSAIPPAIAIRHWQRHRATLRKGLCPFCGYDLRATPDRCPECGRATVTRFLL